MTTDDADKLLSGYISILLRAVVASLEQENELLRLDNQRLRAELEATGARTHTEKGLTQHG